MLSFFKFIFKLFYKLYQTFPYVQISMQNYGSGPYVGNSGASLFRENRD